MKTIDLSADSESPEDNEIKVIFSINGDHVHYKGGEYMVISDEEDDVISVKMWDLPQLIKAIQLVIDHRREISL